MIGVGDLIVCVDASTPMKRDMGDLAPARKIIGLGFLCEGHTYTVAGISLCGDGFRLEGQPLPSAFYAAIRFRKYEQREEDAELIKRIKSCQPEKVPA